MYEKIQETVQFIKTKTGINPKFGIVLGTGLGNCKEVSRDEWRRIHTGSSARRPHRVPEPEAPAQGRCR